MSNDFRYSEIVCGGEHNRGNVVRLPDGVSSYDLDYYGKSGTDCFNSAFLHLKDYVDYKDERGGKRGYPGKVFGECLYWDFDDSDLDKARSNAVELVERLIAYSHNNIRIYFSGNKGFHAVYIAPELRQYQGSEYFEAIIKRSCIEIAKGLKIDTSIYDKTRIFRTPNSINSGSGLYKIPLTYEELKILSIDDIKDLAKKQRKLTYDTNISEDDVLAELIKSCSENKPEERQSKFSGEILVESILNGFDTGNRNNGFASLAGLWHSKGMSEDMINASLIAINRSHPEPLSDREIDSVVSSICRYGVSEEVRKPEVRDIVTMSEAADSWKNVITKSKETNFGERFNFINDRLKMVIPGDVVGVVASSGVGKSCIGMELTNEEAKSRNMYTLMGSLEMSRAGVFFRAATIEATHLATDDNYVPSAEVAKHILNDDEFKNDVCKKWSNLLIVDKGGLKLEDLIEYFKKAQDIYDGRIGSLLIDYAQNLKGAEDIKNQMVIYSSLKDYAKELNTKLFVLSQCNKTYVDDYSRVEKNHLEGSGRLFHAMDYILTFWRSRDQKNRLHAEILKDRWGDSGYQFDLVRQGLKYHTETFRPETNNGGDW